MGKSDGNCGNVSCNRDAAAPRIIAAVSYFLSVPRNCIRRVHAGAKDRISLLLEQHLFTLIFFYRFPFSVSLCHF
jgi:hypothetical protein